MRSISKIFTSFLIFQSLMFGIGTQFLAIPVTVQEMLFGKNPTLIHTVSKPLIAVSYGNWLADIHVSALTYQRQLFGGTAGFSFRYVALNDLEFRTDRPTDQPLALFNAAAMALDGTYDKQLKIGLLSTKFRYISIQLYNESANGFAVDFGINRAINEQFNVGLSLLNVGNMTDLHQDNPKLPFRVIMGTKYNFQINAMGNSIFLALEKSSTVNGIILRVGDKIDWNKLQFSFGIQSSQKTMSMAVGIGFRLGAYKINYGLQYGTHDLGLPQMIDVSIILP